jgi:hypothetical protein
MAKRKGVIAMSIFVAFLVATQPVIVANIQAIPFNATDCKTVFIPMNYDVQRQVDKRVKSKARPMQRPQPNPRPCLTRASG